VDFTQGVFDTALNGAPPQTGRRALPALRVLALPPGEVRAIVGYKEPDVPFAHRRLRLFA
jgi:hypothetical protein